LSEEGRCNAKIDKKRTTRIWKGKGKPIFVEGEREYLFRLHSGGGKCPKVEKQGEKKTPPRNDQRIENSEGGKRHILAKKEGKRDMAGWGEEKLKGCIRPLLRKGGKMQEVDKQPIWEGRNAHLGEALSETKGGKALAAPSG